MDTNNAAHLLVELAEKMGLLAAAALLAVLVPPLRNRILGVGRRKDKLAAVGLGLVLSAWGANLGFDVGGEHINVRAIGILIAAILGGTKAGFLTGLGGGVFYAVFMDADNAPWVITASVVDGVLAGIVAENRPRWVQGWRVFFTATAIQVVHLLVVGAGLIAVGTASRHLPAWPAHGLKLLVNGAGVTLFVVVARLVVSREEQAVALVEARAHADAASLEALRRRLEPHFLFNALNVVRATIRHDPMRARDLISDLADLYRYLLSHPDEAALSAEVDHACAYLAIERARLGDGRLTVERAIPEGLGDLPVPALLLQPLVENAVKHGVARRDGPGRVRLAAWEDEQDLVVEIEDASSGRILPPTTAGSGIALDTLRRRLARRYGNRASLQLSPTPDGMRARVRLPVAKRLARQAA